MSFWRTADLARVAVVEPDGTEVTAGALLAGCHQISHGLRARGLSPGATIVVAMDSAAALLELHLAALQIGLYVVPLDARLNAGEVEALVGDALVVREVESLKAGQPASPPATRVSGAIVFYSSGTTGRPRGTRPPLPPGPPDGPCFRGARRRLAAVGLVPGDPGVHLAVSPLHHSAALAWCLAHLHLGHRVVLMDQWSATGVLERIERHRVTATFMVPTHFHRLLAARGTHEVSSLRHVVHGGAPCSVEIKRRMFDWWGPVIYEVYGAAGIATGTCVGPHDWLARPGTVGRGPVRVLRDDDSECSPGEIGEISFRPGGRSGDLGHVDEEGWLFLSGRKSDVIISGGVNVHSAEIEAVLATHPRVEDVAVIGVPDDEWGEQVKAVVTPAPPAGTEAAFATELIAFCRARLAPWKCPRSVSFAFELPRGANGKLYKQRLREQYALG